MATLAALMTSLAPDAGEEVDWADLQLLQGLPEQAEYRVAATGAMISLRNAKTCLYQYCAKLPSDM